TALVWHRPLRPLAASWVLLAATWLAVLAPISTMLCTFIGYVPPPNAVMNVLEVAAGLATLAMGIARPRWIAAVALAGQLALAWVIPHLTDVDQAFSSMHVLWFAVLWGLHLRINHREERPREAIAPLRIHRRDDWIIFGAATLLALAVGYFVLELALDSADEWGYEWQALVFSHFKAYVPTPPCPEAHRAHWVFDYHGRSFSQYLPGWPLFLAPFARAKVPWLASPIAFGAMCVGVARLARRARGRTAGYLAAIFAGLGPAMLLNGGSVYCHCYVAALFAWMVEAACALTDGDISTRGQWGWGLALGSATSLCLCTRPSDGAFLGLGVFLYFVYALIKRQIGWRGFLGTGIAFSFWGILTLVILHAQLGVWFKTGYSIAGDYYHWARAIWSIPGRDAWKYAIPFGSFAYCFWPAAPAIGVPGLMMLGRRQAFMLGVGTLSALGFYASLQFGRYTDFGYGPRYQLVAAVPLSIGMAVLLAPLWDGLRKRKWLIAARSGEGPAALAFAALLVGVVRIAPTMYPDAHAQLHRRAALRRGIQKSSLHHAVVTVRDGETAGGPLLDTQNDPTDADLDVVVLSPAEQACTRELYEGRTFYRAAGMEEVTFTPY
ncbi:MAG: hypothetical protein ABI175_28375, partial [Polyangiales bacterium]